ncbi:hypothetical protein ACLOJK_034188 [Asimina triloba]
MVGHCFCPNLGVTKKEKSGPEMDGGRAAGRDLDESDVDRDPIAVLCRHLAGFAFGEEEIHQGGIVACWMRFGAVDNEDGGCHRLLLDLLEDLKMERNNEAVMVGFE